MPEDIVEYLPIIIPLIILQLILAITALVHIFRHPNVRKLSRPLWILIVLFVNTIGPVLYFTMGRGDNK